MKRLLFILLATLVVASSSEHDDFPHTTLHSGQILPLYGLGVGNLQYELLVSQISQGVQNMNYRLIDTAHASRNEHLVSDGIVQGLAKASDTVEVHVMTKIWYTHLGYERTKISVKESLEQLKSPNIKVHILLHWPRCRTDISWMNCEKEEEDLPQFVKDAGPAPHLDKDNAFKESWRALEDIFLGEISYGDDLPQVVSIGVSNFDQNDLKDLMSSNRIDPHIMQGNVWSHLFDPHLTEYLRDHNIHFQAYNVMNGIFGRSQFPNALHALSLVAEGMDGEQYTPAQAVLKWLTQQHVSVIPRTTSMQHLQENSANSLEGMEELSESDQHDVEHAVSALLRGKDLDPPVVSFVNQHSDTTLHLFWTDREGKEVPITENLKPGETFDTSTFPGHVFVAYDANNKSQRREFTVQARFGQTENFDIDELHEL